MGDAAGVWWDDRFLFVGGGDGTLGRTRQRATMVTLRGRIFDDRRSEAVEGMTTALLRRWLNVKTGAGGGVGSRGGATLKDTKPEDLVLSPTAGSAGEAKMMG